MYLINWPLNDEANYCCIECESLTIDLKSGRICHLNHFNRRCKTNFSEVYLLDLLEEFVPLWRSVRCSLIFLLLNIIPEFPERTLLDYLYTGQLPQSVDEEGMYGSKWIMMSIGFCFIVFSCCFLCPHLQVIFCTWRSNTTCLRWPSTLRSTLQGGD